MLKRYEDEGRPVGDQPLLAWAFHDAVHKIETGAVRRAAQFPDPSGRLAAVAAGVPARADARRPPSDRLGHRAAALLMTPCDARDAPGRRRVPDALRRTTRPAASTATCRRSIARRAGRAQVPQGAEEQRHRGAGLRTRNWTKACAKAGSPPRTRAAGRIARDDAGCDHGRRFRVVGVAWRGVLRRLRRPARRSAAARPA